MDSIADSTHMSLSKLWEMVKDREAWNTAVHGVGKELDTTEQLNDGNHNLAKVICKINHHKWRQSSTQKYLT